MDEFEKWMRVIESDGEVEEEKEDDAKEDLEESEGCGGCGSYDCDECFPGDKAVSENIIDENEIYDTVYELAEEDEFEDDLDEAYDDDEEEIEEMRIDDIEEGEKWNDDVAAGAAAQRKADGGVRKMDPETLEQKRARWRAESGKKKGVREEGPEDFEHHGDAETNGLSSATSAVLDEIEDEFGGGRKGGAPEIRQALIRAVRQNEGKGLHRVLDGIHHERSYIEDQARDWFYRNFKYDIEDDRGIHEADDEEFDTGDSSAEFASDGDAMVDIGDEPGMGGPDPMKGMDKEMGQAEISSGSEDVSDLIAKIAYVQDMGMSMSDRFYDPDKLAMMKPEMIQRIHSKVVGVDESASVGGMGAGSVAMEDEFEMDGGDEMEFGGEGMPMEPEMGAEMGPEMGQEAGGAPQGWEEKFKAIAAIINDEDMIGGDEFGGDEMGAGSELDAIPQDMGGDEFGDEEQFAQPGFESVAKGKGINEAADPDIVKAMKALFE